MTAVETITGLCPGCGNTSVLEQPWLICTVCLLDRVNGAGELETDDPDDELAAHFARIRKGEARIEKERELQLFGRALPANPLATAGRQPCAVCKLRYLRPLDAAHHLCPHCAEDLPRTQAHVATMLAGVERQIDALNQAEAARVEALPDDVSERWARMYHAWHTADVALAKAMTARYAADVPVETRAQVVRDARSRLEAVQAKVERTAAQVPVLAPHIAAWRTFQRELARLQQERARWQIAAQEVEAAAGGVPF